MTTTPEGKVKDKVKKLFDSYKGRVYHFWPVQTGYGSATLDCLACVDGLFFSVETKAPKKKPTARQEEVMRRMRLADAATFVVAEEEDIDALKNWIDRQLTATKQRYQGDDDDD